MLVTLSREWMYAVLFGFLLKVFGVWVLLRYRQSSWGWNAKEKKEEMTEKEARFLIAFIDDKPVAFSHFRFDMDYGYEVTYW